MKIKVIYYELKEKEFRSKKTLNKFLRHLLPSEILQATEIKDRISYRLELKDFIESNR